MGRRSVGWARASPRCWRSRTRSERWPTRIWPPSRRRASCRGASDAGVRLWIAVSGGPRLGYGRSAEDKYATSYFCHAFDVADPTQIQQLRLRVLADDGAAVFLNGQAVARVRISEDASYRTYAYTTPPDESVYEQFVIDPALLIEGYNCLAVEVHQHTAMSSDVSFDLELVATPISQLIVQNLFGESAGQIPARSTGRLSRGSRHRYGDLGCENYSFSMLRNLSTTCVFLRAIASKNSAEIERASPVFGSTINGVFVFAGRPATPTRSRLLTIIEAHSCHDENQLQSIQARFFWKSFSFPWGSANIAWQRTSAFPRDESMRLFEANVRLRRIQLCDWRVFFERRTDSGSTFRYGTTWNWKRIDSGIGWIAKSRRWQRKTDRIGSSGDVDRRTSRWTRVADLVGVKWNANWRRRGQLGRYLACRWSLMMKRFSIAFLIGLTHGRFHASITEPRGLEDLPAVIDNYSRRILAWRVLKHQWLYLIRSTR